MKTRNGKQNLLFIGFAIILLSINCVCKSPETQTAWPRFTAFPRRFDSLFKNKELLLVAITYQGCIACTDELFRDVDSGKNTATAQIDIFTSPAGKMLSQALHTHGFPTFYLFDRKYTLKAIIEGKRYLKPKTDSILRLHIPVSDAKIDGIEKDSVPVMLSLAVKALFAYWNNETRQMKHYADASLVKGSYFFNNYLLYLAAISLNNPESGNFYRNKLFTDYSAGLNGVIYKDIIQSLQSNH